MASLNTMSATDAARRIAAGTITSEALLADCLARIEDREDVVGAWQHLDPDQALAEARARDREPRRGPLHGLPVGIKDIIETADAPTAYGSPIYAGHRPDADAACVRALRAAGAVIMGKTVTTEFAVFHPGKTRNPHDPDHTPGGSSSGSAAAVADLMIPLALGSQTAGSVIRPAAFCGVVGFKPSYDAIDYGGIKPGAPALDTLGVFARSVADTALIAQAIGRADRGLARIDPTVLAGPAPRVGLCRTPEWDRADAATRALLEKAASVLDAAESPTPAAFSGLVDAQDDIMWAGLADTLAPEMRDHGGQLSDGLGKKLAAGAALPPARVAAARQMVAACTAELDSLFGDRDVLIAPAAVGEAPVGTATGDPLFNRIWTQLHLPCLTLPAGTGPAGLPLGIQIIGCLDDEARLLRGAAWIEGMLADRPIVLVEPA